MQVVASVGLWLGWAAVLGATLVPRAATLTAVRLAAPAPLAVAVACVVAGPAGGDDAVALGARRGDRRRARCCRRPPTRSSTARRTAPSGASPCARRRRCSPGPVPVAWLLAVVAPATAALLLAAGAWVGGAALAVVGGAGIALGVPALHRLSRRWLVFVPAGLVVHDHVALADPVLLRRAHVHRASARRRPEPSSPAPSDLTLGASGLALELAVDAPVEVAVARGGGRRREAVGVRADRVAGDAAAPGGRAGRGAGAALPGGDGRADHLVAVVEHDELARRHPPAGLDPAHHAGIDVGSIDVGRQRRRRGRCTAPPAGRPGARRPTSTRSTGVTATSRSASAPTTTVAVATSTSTT